LVFADSNLLDCCSQVKLRESLTESECRIRKLPSQIPFGFLAFFANGTFERNSWTSGEKNDFLGGLSSGSVKNSWSRDLRRYFRGTGVLNVLPGEFDLEKSR